MSTTRRDFIAGVCSLVAVPAAVGAPQAFTEAERYRLRKALADIYDEYGFPVECCREWPYDLSGGLREQLAEVVKPTWCDAPARWDWVLKSDADKGVRIEDLRTAYLLLTYRAQDLRDTPTDWIRYYGSLGWYLEHRKTGERVQVDEGWVKEFYTRYKNTYKEEYENHTASSR